MYSIFKRHEFDPRFEEPDLSVDVGGKRVSVACKKVYSNKRVQNSLSEAVRQIDRSKRHGIVAVNIDDLIGENMILRGPYFENSYNTLNQINLNFMKCHEHHLRRYFDSSKIAACIVSSSVISESLLESPPINNHSQATLWAVPKLGSERQRIVDGLYSKMFSVRTS